MKLQSISSLWQPSTQASPWLVVVLHGRGDSPEGWADFKALLKLDLNFILLQAPDRSPPGYSWYAPAPHQLPGIQRSRELLGRVFSEIESQGFPPERTILMGFSQGCLMTLEFGARYPKKLAGYLGISGYCFDPVTLAREAPALNKAGPWLITHGTADDVLPVENTRQNVQELRQAGFAIDYREYAKAHDLNLHSELSDIRAWISKITAK